MVFHVEHQDDISLLLGTFSGSYPFQQIHNSFNRSHKPISVSGIFNSSILSLFVSALIKHTGRFPVVLFNNPVLMDDFIYNIESFISAESLALLPDLSNGQNEDYSWFLKNDAYHKIISKQVQAIIAPVNSLNISLPSQKHPEIIVSVGMPTTKDEFISTLDNFNYNREFSVEFPGEYATRGDIVDIYSFGTTYPVRIEFFGDTIESLRLFDPNTLETVSHIKKTSVIPLVTDDPEQASSLFSFLPDNTVFILSGYDTNRDVFRDAINQNKNFLKYSLIQINDLASSEIHFQINTHENLFAGFSGFKSHLSSLIDKNIDGSFFLFCSDSGQYERFSSLLAKDRINIINRPLSAGFEIPDQNLFVFSDSDIFPRRHRPRSFSFLPPEIKHTKFNPTEIDYNDLVVHLDYGIGQYHGLDKITAFGAERECLVISYANNDKVFVPLEKMSLVHKYRSSSDIQPKISRLGSGEWDRIKLKTRRSVEELSEEIIRLYSERYHSAGFAFSADTEFQLMMEAEFPFEETADQIKAINEIKADMESSSPMDRLLCGDVGFGKTEVAIRAAFKAVSDSKQVAILTPTTILADQHYFTFKSRLKKYPVKVERLSRFVGASKQKNILRQLAVGDIDIIIGTHRLLSKDVSFSNLGLLIIDEEHRFGVADKDKIKKYRSNIDVLSLSATPIPRSLHFSLIGARDFSLINTPPKERLPIFTEIISFDKEIIKRAVQREIDRGGQVFFVHNEVKTIASITATLKQMFPDLDIQYVHGQMSEKILEPIMLDFVNNKIQILVTTAIIESGIDIPNANTIFINKAHKFGLSQLYQLRGRVGRLDRQAYAYLIVSNPSRLTPKAIRRLQSIKRHTSLGSGYLISMEDLEIRGAGNIFGVEQSGNIHAVGYDLYIKILQDAIDNLKDHKTDRNVEVPEQPHKKDISIIFPFPAFIPESYIPSESLRLSYYQQLTSADNFGDIDSIRHRILDIFGKCPTEMDNLFSLVFIRLACIHLNINKLKFDKELCLFHFESLINFNNPNDFISILKDTASSSGLSYKFIPSDNLVMAIYINKQQKIDMVKQFLYHLEVNLNLGR
ncbi:MAG: transcription-repair coupling factor [Candidatus Neomarinimicrobiota bacterium]|nr:MAG: transcription-repair coupling factor [Candidatus Neomarinimicrobiota bacterium]